MTYINWAVQKKKKKKGKPDRSWSGEEEDRAFCMGKSTGSSCRSVPVERPPSPLTLVFSHEGSFYREEY